jgi:hypothetical protein
MSSDNPDIRQQVEENRGTLKKLQLLIPGLSGYRRLEDLRVADELLRNQVADKVDQAKTNLESLRKQMVTSGNLTGLPPVASLISQFQQLSGEVRHSPQGYAGFVPTIKIDESKLNSLYENDYNFVSSAVSLVNLTSPANLVYDTTAPNSVQIQLANVGSAIRDFKEKWSVRMETIERILVK